MTEAEKPAKLERGWIFSVSPAIRINKARTQGYDRLTTNKNATCSAR